MIVVFLVMMVLGLGAFFFVFLKEMRSGHEAGGAVAAVPTEPSLSLSRTLPVDPEISAGSGIILKKGRQAPEEIIVDKLDQKCLKLEQLLEEKNHALARIENDLKSERAHRAEFEEFKEILQRQIEDLKAQNRRLRDDLERTLRDGVKASEGKIGDAAASASPSSDEALLSDPLLTPVALPADIFGQKNKE